MPALNGRRNTPSDADGLLIEIDGEEFDCERDSDGRMTSIILEGSAEDDEDSFTTIETRLIYDSKNRVIKTTAISADEQWTQNYTYDANGLLKQRDYDNLGDDESQTYTYLKFDSYGNWTERLEKQKSMDQTIRQTRIIIYGE